MTGILRLTEYSGSPKGQGQGHGQGRRGMAPVYFDRRDLNILLNLYSRHVARGDWRDYAIAHDPGIARFCVFRHSHETPLYTVTKRVQGGRPLYGLFDGIRKLRQGADLPEVLAPLSKLRLIGS